MKGIIIQRCTNRASCKKVKQKFCGFSVKPPGTTCSTYPKGTRRCRANAWSKIGPKANRLRPVDIMLACNNTINTSITDYYCRYYFH